MSRHLTCAELAALLEGVASRDLIAEFLEHHLEVCEVCRDEYELSESGESEVTSWQEVVEVATALSAERAERLARFEQVARREFRELMRLPASARRYKINRAINRFRNPILVDLLLAESKGQVTRDPWTALALAECAFDAAFRVSHREFGQAWAMTSLARAHAHRGNALRVTGDFKQANDGLLLALRIFDEDGNGDPLIEAEILSFLASLRMDQRSFVEAGGYLDMARGIYEKINETRFVGLLLVQKSMLLFNAGDFDQALVVGLEALEAIDPSADSKLYLSAEHNYTFFLMEVGRYREAWERLEAHASLYDAFPDSWTQLRRQKLQGEILRGLGRREEAEATLIAVRAGFVREGLGFHAAMAGLDLAYLYVEEGRTEEVKKLAEEMVPIFMAQDIHREAAAALLLFQEAARQETVTLSMLKEIVAYMGRVRTEPARKPS